MLNIGELGASSEYAEVRGALDAWSFTEESACERLGLDRLCDFELHPAGRQPLAESRDPLGVLIRVFLYGEFEDVIPAGKILGEDRLALLQRMGLVETDGRRCSGTVALYPAGGMLIASDRWSHPDGSPFEAPPDTVYPAMLPNTRVFLDLLPFGPCDNFLDLGAGTGIAALMAARQGARHSWAGDIADRCTRFADFNGRLNGVSNFTAITSDLYKNLGDRTFDRIVSHPPYVPALTPKWIFYSGGEDGEEVTRGIVGGLPRHLREGGLCCCLTMGSDRKNRPFEQRIREWLGREENQFDVALVVRKLLDPSEFAARSNSGARRPEAKSAWKRLFARLQVESLAYGFVLVQRKTESRGTFTVRRQASTGFSRSDWEWLLRWESEAAGSRMAPLILESRLHAAAHAEFQVKHRLGVEGWAPQAYWLRTERPFEMDCEIQPWMAHLMALCDGQSTGRQLLQTLQACEALPEGVPPAEFASAVADLVSGGFVEVEGLRPPQATG